MTNHLYSFGHVRTAVINRVKQVRVEISFVSAGFVWGTVVISVKSFIR